MKQLFALGLKLASHQLHNQQRGAMLEQNKNLLTHTMELNLSSNANSSSASQKNSQHFRELVSSLPCSQQPI
jgi:hypothetical protein